MFFTAVLLSLLSNPKCCILSLYAEAFYKPHPLPGYQRCSYSLRYSLPNRHVAVQSTPRGQPFFYPGSKFQAHFQVKQSVQALRLGTKLATSQTVACQTLPFYTPSSQKLHSRDLHVSSQHSLGIFLPFHHHSSRYAL